MNYSSNYSKLLNFPAELQVLGIFIFTLIVTSAAPLKSPEPRDFLVYRQWDASLLVGNKLGTSVSKEKFSSDIQGNRFFFCISIRDICSTEVPHREREEYLLAMIYHVGNYSGKNFGSDLTSIWMFVTTKRCLYLP